MDIFWFLLQALLNIPLLPRDIGSGLDDWSLNRQISSWTSKGWTIHQIFDQVAEKNAEKPAIRINEMTWNFKKLKDNSLMMANYFKNSGFSKGDTVAILVEDHPRYVATWLGLSRIGVVSALLHTGMKGDVLLHAITKSTKPACKAIVVSGHLLPVLEELKSSNKLPADIKVFIEGPQPPQTTVDAKHIVLQVDDESLMKPIDDAIVRAQDMNSNMVYVFTSGLKDKPKAAALTFKKFTFLATAVHKMTGIRNKDVIYNPIPLFHATGGLVGTGQMLLFGNTMITTKTFKATEYFPNCKKFKATVAQYTGAMPSFLFLMKKSSADRDHSVRLMFGSGFRALLWKDFKKRFGVKQIGEFYGSIEGNTYLFNKNNKVGSLGFKPWFSRQPDLVEFNHETGEPFRDQNGLCKRSKWSGLHVEKLEEISNATPDDDEGKSNIIENVFKKGDKYVDTDHVLKRNIFNYYYIVDRVSYPFRWKGDGVAKEAQDAIVGALNLKSDQVVMYGVQIGDMEGKASMVAIDMDDSQLDKKKLLEFCEGKLSKYLMPAILRVSQNLPKTGSTINKEELQKQGFDPAKLVFEGKADNLYYYKADEESPQYAPLIQGVHFMLVGGHLSF